MEKEQNLKIIITYFMPPAVTRNTHLSALFSVLPAETIMKLTSHAQI